MKIAHKLISSVLLFFILVSIKAQAVKDLTADQFEKGITSKDSVLLLDVRTPGEFNAGHIKNALLADWKDENEFNRRIAYIDKQIPVYVYCLAGSRSAAAAAKMRAMGYQNVYELKGGINAWKAASKAMEGKSSEKQMSLSEMNTSINGSKLVLVDFGAEWCIPCKKMEPVLKKLQNKYPNKFTIVKVDGGRDTDILNKYKVTTLPVFILFREGEQVWRKDGIAEEKEIAELIN